MECKKELELLSGIAESAQKDNLRHEIEVALTSTFTPEQRKKWLALEELIYQEQNRVQEATVTALVCPSCTIKPCKN